VVSAGWTGAEALVAFQPDRATDRLRPGGVREGGVEGMRLVRGEGVRTCLRSVCVREGKRTKRK
jgi:hypothetical protein